jgi:hypothetical protein
MLGCNQLAHNKTINIIRFAHWEKSSLQLRCKALGFSRYCKRYISRRMVWLKLNILNP